MVKAGLGGVVLVCGECYNLGLNDWSVVFVLSPSLLYFVFENFKERVRSPCNGNHFSI